MGTSAPLRITLRPSAALTAFLLLSHGLALLAVGLTAWPLAGQTVLILLVVVSLAHAVWRHRHGMVVAVETAGPGQLRIQSKGGDWQDVRVSGQSLVLYRLILLHLQFGDGKSRWLVLPQDAMTKDAHRRLRTWLRWRGQLSASQAKAGDQG